MSVHVLLPFHLNQDADRDLQFAAGLSSSARQAMALRWIRRGLDLYREQGWGAYGAARLDDKVRTMLLPLTAQESAVIDEIRAIAEGGDDLQAVLHSLLWNGSLFDYTPKMSEDELMAFAAE
ncbi:hypothetical protein [Roseiterribacter gracilis]|uniref:Uncharacterized protein n=1 Tax=Roseiterribacter gracilis TaxID=2812848 RepID=A0A8S8XF98_9PROT|nr:hypothetical protein TMPK1_21330 [Rhodospirillales bacterium TMPK1]